MPANLPGGPDPRSLTEELARYQVQEIHASLKKLERRESWQWWFALFIMMGLLGVIFILMLPGTGPGGDREFRFEQEQAFRGLFGLVLLFTAYTLYQRYTIRGLRQQMVQQSEALTSLHLVAEELRKLAVLDPLTGLYNRRLADQRLVEEMARAERHGHVLTVMVFDLNNFKQVNDRFGHQAGDAVLQHFAAQLDSIIRVSDMAARTGGDEFLVILPEYQGDEIQNLLGRLKSLEVSLQNEKIPINFTVGSAGYRQGETPQELVERADQVLYANKNAVKVEKAAGDETPAETD